MNFSNPQIRRIPAPLVLLFSLCNTSSSYATDIVLPDPTSFAVLYGDFYSYSLPILASNYDIANGGAIGLGPQNPFYIDSSPGKIKNDIVLGTGASGQQLNKNFDGMEWSYETPNSSGITYRTTGEAIANAGLDPQNESLTAAQDNKGTWDSTIAALDTYLGTGINPIFFFNNNQTNSGTSLDQQLAIWMQVTLWNSADPTGTAPLVFTLANHCPAVNLCIDGGEIVTDGGGIVIGPDKDPALYSRGLADNLYPATEVGGGTTPTYDDFVLSGGKVCIDDDAGQTPVDCSLNIHEREFDHNLGADQAAYAVYSEELNNALSEWRLGNLTDYDMFSVDFRLGCNPNPGSESYNCDGRELNNGYEQIFLARGEISDVPPPPRTIDEPTPLFIMLISGSALFANRRLKLKA